MDISSVIEEPFETRLVCHFSLKGKDAALNMILFIILLGNLMFPVHGNVFDYLPKKPCDSLVVGVSSYASFEGRY